MNLLPQYVNSGTDGCNWHTGVSILKLEPDLVQWMYPSYEQHTPIFRSYICLCKYYQSIFCFIGQMVHTIALVKEHIFRLSTGNISQNNHFYKPVLQIRDRCLQVLTDLNLITFFNYPLTHITAVSIPEITPGSCFSTLIQYQTSIQQLIGHSSNVFAHICKPLSVYC